MTRRGLGVVLSALPLAAMLWLSWWGGARERRWLAEATAQTAAGYLSLVVPRSADGVDFDDPRLISAASRVKPLVGMPFAVYRRGVPVTSTGRTLPARLDRSLRERLLRVDAPTTEAGVAYAPLKDPDDWETVGAVGVQLDRPPAVPLAPLGLAVAAFLAIAWALIRRAHSRRLVLVAVLAGITAWTGYRHVHQAAEHATDQWLGGVGRLAGLAVRSVPRPSPTALARLARGATVEVAREGSDAPTREIDSGVPRASIAATLPRGGVVSIATVPRERTLEWLFAGLALLAAATIATAWVARMAIDSGASRAARRRTRTAYSFLLPGLVHLIVFSAVPIAFTVWLSVHRWSLLEPVRPFVGFQNYLSLARDPLTWRSLLNTALFSLYVPATTVVALAFALVVERRGTGVTALRTLLFLPYVSSVVAIAIVWQWMYHPDVGLINYALDIVGFAPVDWLGNPRTALVALMLVAGWAQVGYQTVVFVAGLQGIPSQYHDAARVDGAGWWQRLRYVTIPLLAPVTLFVLVTGVIGSFQVFTFVYVMTEGNPLHATDVIVYRIYQLGWEFLQFGSASALSLVLAALLVGVTWLQFRLLGRRVEHA